MLEDILAKYGVQPIATLDTLMPLLLQADQGGGGAAPSSLTGLANRLERKGFDVGGLEGYEGMGQITSGHVPNSYHYRGRAMDVSYDPSQGRWGSETQALNWLARWLNKRYDPIELFWPGYDPVGGHDSHLHFAI